MNRSQDQSVLSRPRWPWFVAGTFLFASALCAAVSVHLVWLPCRGTILGGMVSSIGEGQDLTDACLRRMDEGFPFLYFVEGGDAAASSAHFGSVAMMLGATAWIVLVLGLPVGWRARCVALIAAVAPIALAVLNWPALSNRGGGTDEGVSVWLWTAVDVGAVAVFWALWWKRTDLRRRILPGMAFVLWGATAFGLLRLLADFFAMVAISEYNWDVPSGTGWITVGVLVIAGAASFVFGSAWLDSSRTAQENVDETRGALSLSRDVDRSWRAAGYVCNRSRRGSLSNRDRPVLLPVSLVWWCCPMKRHRGLERFLGLLAVLILALVVASCSGTSDSFLPSAGDPVPAQGDAEAGLPQEDGAEGGDESGRLVIRTKTLRLEVVKTSDAMDEIRTLTGAHSGTVSDLELATDSDDPLYRYDENGNPQGDGTALRGWVTVRVPTDEYEEFVAAIAKLGVVKFQSEAASDVTQEYVDLSARLENLRAQEVRLREFFDAAKDVKDMLAVETELGRVRGEIESLDAQVTLLERQAAMATITVELTEPRAVVRPGGESWGFVDAITTGVRGAAGLMTGLLTFLIASAPLWIVGVLLFFVIRAVLRRRRRKAPQTQPLSPPRPPQTPPRVAGEAPQAPSR